MKMKSDLWINHADLPAEGLEYTINDQNIWLSGLERHNISCIPSAPVESFLRLLPQENGFLVMGDLSYSVFLPCKRCAEEYEASFQVHFEEFEGLDKEDSPPEDDLVRQGVIGLQLNLSGFLWEQFVLALPDNPLCRPDCRGLCSFCGGNLNEGLCSCEIDRSDPRFAALRNLKIS